MSTRPATPRRLTHVAGTSEHEHAVTLDANTLPCPVGAVVLLQAVVIVDGVEVEVTSSTWTFQGPIVESAQQEIAGATYMLQPTLTVTEVGGTAQAAWAQPGTYTVEIACVTPAGAYGITGAVQVLAPTVEDMNPVIGAPAVVGDQIDEQELALVLNGEVGIKCFIPVAGGIAGIVGIVQTTTGITTRTSSACEVQSMGSNVAFLDNNQAAGSIWYTAVELEPGDAAEITFTDQPTLLLEMDDPDFPGITWMSYTNPDNFTAYVAYQAIPEDPAFPYVTEALIVVGPYFEWMWSATASFNGDDFSLSEETINQARITSVQPAAPWTLPQWTGSAADYQTWPGGQRVVKTGAA